LITIETELNRTTEKVTIWIHRNLRPADVAPVFLGFNYQAHNASAYKFNNLQPSRTREMMHLRTKFQHNMTFTAELLLIQPTFTARF